jgi:hypothetical protein
MSHFANEFTMIWQSHTYCSLLTKVIRNSLNFDYRLLLWLKQNTVLSFTIQLHLLLNSTLLHVWPWGKCYSKTVHIIQYVFQMCPLSYKMNFNTQSHSKPAVTFPKSHEAGINFYVTLHYTSHFLTWETVVWQMAPDIFSLLQQIIITHIPIWKSIRLQSMNYHTLVKYLS